MKVIHIIKRIETIDQDIKELRKLEKSLEKNKSFSQPIFMTIEKQVNILLGERIKLLELEIKNPPALLPTEGSTPEVEDVVATSPIASTSKKQSNGRKAKVATKSAPNKNHKLDTDLDDDDIPVPMLTQDAIDKKFENLKAENPTLKKEVQSKSKHSDSDDGVKLLDIALQSGTLTKQEIMTEKKRIRFFRDNFPGGEY